MAALQASIFNMSSSSFPCRMHATKSTINLPNKLTINALSLPNLSARVLVEQLQQRSSGSGNNSIYKNKNAFTTIKPSPKKGVNRSPTTIPKLYAVLEAISDRIEMHHNIKEQRENWNSLLLNSVNSIILTASTISAVAAAGGTSHVVALTSCSSLLYLAATGLLIIVNKIQPSQLAEEQRNAARLFKKLRREIETKLSIGSPKSSDVREAMEKVLALDRAYPLPLLGKMLEKFPNEVEPAKWWPEQQRQSKSPEAALELEGSNGWEEGLEERMRGVVKVLRSRDKEDYLRLGEKALKLNKVLGVAGPVLTTVAAVGSALMGPSHSGLATMIGVAAGGMAAVINAVEHGGQVGMVFEMYRSNAGFFELMEEWIEGSLKEKKGTNGKVMEMKVALELGRSLSELRNLTDSPLFTNQEEFGSKLF